MTGETGWVLDAATAGLSVSTLPAPRARTTPTVRPQEIAVRHRALLDRERDAPRALGRDLWIYVDLTQNVGLHSLCSALCHAYGVGGYAVKPLACAARGQHGAFTSPVAGRSRAHAQIISATATPWARRAEAHERRT